VKTTTVRVKDLKRAIRDIEQLNCDLIRLGRRATPDIVGFYGELLVWKVLKSHFGWQGYKIDLGQGQTRSDIEMVKNKKKINIEVKTSRLKKEWHGEGYGFALNIKKCKVHKHVTLIHPKRGSVNGSFCYFDFLIGVLLSDDLKEKEFYIIPRSFIEKNEAVLRNTDKRFSSATHRMVFLGTPSGSKLITRFDRAFVKRKANYKDKWSTIK
jgi:hypothetical protein